MSEYLEQVFQELEARAAEAKAKWDKINEEERKWKNAYIATGLGCSIPTYHLGFRPSCVEARGGVIKVYQECIKKGIPWEELCGWDPNGDDPAGGNK